MRGPARRARRRRPVIEVKRAYEAPAATDGRRVLVDRVWPRGVSRAALRLDAWAKDVAPSTRLRTWFAHDAAKWREFELRYTRELDARPEVVAPLVEASDRTKLTLIFGARDIAHNNAVVLKAYLERRAAQRRG